MGASLKLQAQASAQRISAAPFPFPITRTSSCIVLCMEQHVAQAPEEQMNDFFTRSWARQLSDDYNG
jgi:hypothetical protein